MGSVPGAVISFSPHAIKSSSSAALISTLDGGRPSSLNFAESVVNLCSHCFQVSKF